MNSAVRQSKVMEVSQMCAIRQQTAAAEEAAAAKDKKWNKRGK